MNKKYQIFYNIIFETIIILNFINIMKFVFKV